MTETKSNSRTRKIQPMISEDAYKNLMLMRIYTKRSAAEIVNEAIQEYANNHPDMLR